MTLEKLLNFNDIKSLISKYSITYDEIIKLIEEKILYFCKIHYNDADLEIKLYKNKDKLDPYIVLSNKTKIRIKNIDLKVIADVQSGILKHLDNSMKIKNFSKIESMSNSLIQVEIKNVRRHDVTIVFMDNIYTIGIESFVPGESIVLKSKTYLFLEKVEKDEKGNINLYANRTSKEFVEELLKLFIPEVSNYSIIIKSIHRIPLFYTVVIIDCKRTRNYRPINACLGINGERKKSIGLALGGERISFIRSSQTIEDIIRVILKLSNARIVIEKNYSNEYHIIIYNYIKYIRTAQYRELLQDIFPEYTFIVEKRTILTREMLEGVCNDDKIDIICEALPNISDIINTKPNFFTEELGLTNNETVKLFIRLLKTLYSIEDYNLTAETVFNKDLSIKEYYHNYKNNE